jgi:hypothetical protein
VREPVGEGGEEVAGGCGGGAFGADGDVVDAEFVGEGESFDLGDDLGDALGEVGEELAQVAEDGGQGDGEEEAEGESDSGDEEDDGDGAVGTPVADPELADEVDQGG